MKNEEQVCTEVYTILSELPSKYIDKIPHEIISGISDKADTKYSYKIDELLPQSKAILVEIIRKYLREEEIAKNINKFIADNIKISEQKKGTYKDDIFLNKKNESNSNQINDNSKIIHYEKSIFKKIINKMKLFFTKYKK